MSGVGSQDVGMSGCRESGVGMSGCRDLGKSGVVDKFQI